MPFWANSEYLFVNGTNRFIIHNWFHYNKVGTKKAFLSEQWAPVKRTNRPTLHGKSIIIRTKNTG